MRDVCFGLAEVVGLSASHCRVVEVVRLIKLAALGFQLSSDQQANPSWTTPTTALADNQTTRTTLTTRFSTNSISVDCDNETTQTTALAANIDNADNSFSGQLDNIDYSFS